MTINPKTIKIVLTEDKESPETPFLSNAQSQISCEATKSNKYYLPVLYLNNKEFWPSKELKDRKHWTPEKAFETCVGNCCGVSGLKAACCQIELESEFNHVLGPVDNEDIEVIIKTFSKKGFFFKREDIVIDYEEGQIIGETFFNGHEVFKNKTSYPMLRFQVSGPRFICKFLSAKTGMCTIYSARPKMCTDYICQFVASSFLIKTKDHPNIYKKIR